MKVEVAVASWGGTPKLEDFQLILSNFFFFSSRRRHTRCSRDWTSDVCSSDLSPSARGRPPRGRLGLGAELDVFEGPVEQEVVGDLQGAARHERRRKRDRLHHP